MSEPGRSVLVVGGTGFIGRALIPFLVSEHFRVTALAISGRSQLTRLMKKVNGLNVVEACSMEPTELAKALAGKRFDGVINLAASGVHPDQRTPEGLHEGNSALVLNLIAAVAEFPPELFIQTGSWFEYRPAEKPQRLAEGHSLDTPSQYGSAKSAALAVGSAAAHAMKIPFVCLRLFHVYGPGEMSHRLIPQIVGKLHRGQQVDLTGGEQVRDFIFLADVCEAYKAALLSPNIDQNPVYNVCTGELHTVRDMCEAVAKALGVSNKFLNFGAIPYRDDETLWSVGTDRLFYDVSGWKAKTNLQQGVSQTVESLKKVRNNQTNNCNSRDIRG